MSLDKALQEAVKSVPEAVAAGMVDVDSGMLLGVKTVDSHPNEVLDILAAATADLFQGSNVVTIENLFKKMRGSKDGAKHYFQEFIVNSANLVHVFCRSTENESVVFTVVCRASTNLGMALTKARVALKNCEAAM
jgi:predicted regulator of Ras-like GTPase activity (Roadblock/LC7/MglB family)